MGKFYYTYVLKSEKDSKYYIGWTGDLISRFQKHNKGLVEATKRRLPMQLIYYEACLLKANAIKREKQLKSYQGRLFIKKNILL